MLIRLIEPGDTFGQWTVVKLGEPIHGVEAWVCKCSCGGSRNIRRGDLVGSRSTKCNNCARKGSNNGRYAHGEAGSSLYRTWSRIKRRCRNKDDKDYKYYGARGIDIYDKWHDDYAAFRDAVAKLGPRPPKHSLDRKNNDKGYVPGNLRWANQKEQVANSRRWKRVRM